MRKVKHNKIRNTGLLFEFLLRQITSDVLNKNNGTAVKIVKEKFNEIRKGISLIQCVNNKEI